MYLTRPNEFIRQLPVARILVNRTADRTMRFEYERVALAFWRRPEFDTRNRERLVDIRQRERGPISRKPAVPVESVDYAPTRRAEASAGSRAR